MLTTPTDAPDILEELWGEDFESLTDYFPDEPPKSLEEISTYAPIEVYVEVCAEVSDRMADNLPYVEE